VRREYEWAAGLVLLLFLAACGRPLTHARELATTTLSPPDDPGPTPPHAVARPSVPTPPAPAPAPGILPTGVSQPTPVPTPTPALPPASVARPAPAPTPFPDTPEIVDTVLGTGTSEHWANYLVSGSVTARGADERLALVGNIGGRNEVRWVVVGQGDAGWRLLGTSECLGSGFDVPPSFYVPPDVLDFDGDGRQEVLSHGVKAQGGWKTSADTLYRWDGHALACVWEAPTAMDGPVAAGQGVPQPYRVDYRAEWEWVDLDRAGLDEILLRDHVSFTEPGEGEATKDSAERAGEEVEERAFRWDGEAFRPYAPGGPDGTFAYVGSGDVWLWQDQAARPLGAEHVQDVRWSPDGRYVAWWSQPPPDGAVEGAVLGAYDLSTGVRREWPLERAPVGLDWTPDGRVACALPDQPPVLVDLETGQQEPLPVATLGSWSPDGGRMAYAHDGGLTLYDFSEGQRRALVTGPGEGGAAGSRVLANPAWSPRGDWVACTVADDGFSGVGLVAPDLAEPVSGPDLLETLGGWERTGLEFAWSPDGSRLAALATGLPSIQQLAGLGVSGPTSGRAVLYLAEVERREGESVGRPAWKKVLELETATQSTRLAWSPDGERVAMAAGSELWEVSAAAGEATLRQRFQYPQPRWRTLEWAPDGSGMLAGLESACHGRLYWFPADGSEPVLLLADGLGPAQWAPRTVGAQARPQDEDALSTVFVEYGPYKPRLHFCGADGSDAVVQANGANRITPFQVGGQRVYYYRYAADRRRVSSLPVPDASDGCQPPLVSPDGERLAWVCHDGLPDWQAVISGTAEIHFRVIVTDGRGRDPREVWHHVETGPDYRGVQPLGWRADGAMVYLSRPEYGAAWAYFQYNPGILALHVNVGQATQIGDLEGVHDGLVSPDGAWIVQSRVGRCPEEGGRVSLRSLVEGTERAFACAAGTTAAGDFSFSPESTWLAWREWVRGPAGPKFTIRALRLPDGEPFTVYEDGEEVAPRIGGWLGRDELVLVYPLREDGTGEYSTVVTLPATGPGYPLSPFVFLGVLGGEP
jgi:hypothetical protein